MKLPWGEVVEIITISPDYPRQPAGTPYRLATARYPGGEVKEARIYSNQEYALEPHSK